METKYLSAIKDILAKIEEELNYALPSPSTSHWKENSFGFLDSCIDEKFIDMLTLPSKNLISLGGKRWRPLLLVLSSRMIQQKNNDLQNDSIALKLTPLVEFAHTASLIHDDIEDGADTRRGKPAAHITYGIDAAINAGSFLYFQAASSIKELNVSDSEKSAFYELFLTELRLLHLGQAMDILWHRNKEIIPSIEEYTAMVRNKTGTLARLAVKLGVLGGGGTKEEADSLGKIAQDIGVGFQIIDDVTNLTTGNPGKKRGDDIVEGKKSLPVLLHLKNNPEDKNILVSLFKKAKNDGIESPAVEKAISLLTESGAVQEAKNTGEKFIQQNSKLFTEFFDTPSESALLIRELFSSMYKK